MASFSEYQLKKEVTAGENDSICISTSTSTVKESTTFTCRVYTSTCSNTKSLLTLTSQSNITNTMSLDDNCVRHNYCHLDYDRCSVRVHSIQYPLYITHVSR